jgi:hypothetical protein
MDLTEDKIIEWAMYYASFEELKSTAKNLYRVYAQEEQKYYPEKRVTAKELKLAIKYVKKKKNRENDFGVKTTYIAPRPKKHKKIKKNIVWKESRPIKKKTEEYRIKNHKF